MNGEPELKDVYERLDSIHAGMASIREHIAERVGESKAANSRICTQIEGLEKGQEIIHSRITVLKQNLTKSVWSGVAIILSAIIALVAAYIQRGG